LVCCCDPGGEWRRPITHRPCRGIDLLALSGTALEDLSRSAPAGAIPRGTGRGTAILVPGRGAGRALARWVHDEIREVAPGVFLGLVYVRRRRLPCFSP